MKNKNIKITIAAIIVAFIITTIIYIIGRNIYISRDSKYNLFKNIEERYGDNYELLQVRETQGGDNEISWASGYSAVFISDGKYIQAVFDKHSKEYQERIFEYEPVGEYIDEVLSGNDYLAEARTYENLDGDGMTYSVNIIIKEEYFKNMSDFKKDMLNIMQKYVNDYTILLNVYVARDDEIDTKYYRAVPYVYLTTDEHVEYDAISNNTNILDELIFLGQEGDSYSKLVDEINEIYDNSLKNI